MSTGELKPADFEPPAHNVHKIIKSVLPDNMLMTKEARAAIVRASGIFIFYITHGANDFCRESKRSTIFPQDILNSLK
jgi:DNA polymerase epsilon subunit 3